MTENPYQVSAAATATSGTRATRWLVWCGVASLALAAICIVLTVAGMFLSLDSIANSPATPTPAEMSERISLAVIPSYAATPLGVLGIVLIVLGLLRRKRITKS